MSYRNGQKAVNDLVHQLSSEVSERIDQHLDTYLALPYQLNALMLDAIATGRLNVNRIPQRLNALEYPNPLICASAAHIQQQLGGFQSIQTTQQTEFRDQGERTFVQIHPWRDQYGLNWLMVVAIPESDFMGTIHENTRMTFSLCLMALLLATWMGLITSRWLVRQIHAADTLSQGTWNQRIPESSSIELSPLAKAFNRTAEQLQDLFTRLKYNAYHDALTGLLNQAAFRRQLATMITAAD